MTLIWRTCGRSCLHYPPGEAKTSILNPMQKMSYSAKAAARSFMFSNMGVHVMDLAGLIISHTVPILCSRFTP